MIFSVEIEAHEKGRRVHVALLRWRLRIHHGFVFALMAALSCVGCWHDRVDFPWNPLSE